MLRLGTALLTGALLTALLTTAQTRTQTGIAEPPAGPVASGTARGEPSPRNASYSIDVELNTERRTLTGREVLTWRNISSIATDDLRFHLYYNAWKNTQSTWMRERLRGRGSSLHGRSESDWGWIDVTAIRLLGAGDERPIDLTDTVSYIAPDDGNPHDQTVLAVPLPQPVGPGETVNVEIEWISRVPHTFHRTGTIGDYYFLAQWFPKIGVLEDTGWNCHQFHTATEFFSDYGVYDVRITVPEEWVVGATGVERDRGNNGDGTETHRYYQEDVHDFAWTTSPDFLDLRERFEHPELPAVELRLLLQPEHASQAARHFEATRHTLKHYGEWYGAYPYDHLTIVDPAWQSGSGGMEYPTLFTAGARWLAPAAVSTPEGVTIHEAGHQFWYGAVGNNEFEHAWLDEGLNTFSTARVLETTFTPHHRSTRFFGRFVPWVFRDIPWSRAVDGNRLTGYRRDARMDAQATPTYLYWPGTAGSISYNKTALWLHTLERHLGWPVLQRGMAAFYDRWRFDHPSPDDFFEAITTASGDDLSWFFDQVHGTANVFDYGIQALTSRRMSGRGFFDAAADEAPVFSDESSDGRFETTVVVRRYGEGVFPVDVVTEFADGEHVSERWDGEARWTAFTYEREARATRAVVDPERVLLLDVNYTNNSRTLAPKANEAAMKWSLTWLVWLQDVLLTYGFFI
ncbi:MAG: M1 family metallopeptidase [Vicinamibacterales bacterium]